MGYDPKRAPVAQWTERSRPKAGVGGSSPSGGAMNCSRWALTFGALTKDRVIEVNFDAQGREVLLEAIRRIAAGDHEHAMTPSWGGRHLTENSPNQDLIPIDQVNFHFFEEVPPDVDVRRPHMAATRSKVIITCAVTGSIHTPTMTPYLPITPDQIAEARSARRRPGAAILHLHARDPRTAGRRPTRRSSCSSCRGSRRRPTR